ncbi:MAG: hypothetical protein JWO67_3209 [Streptosporangiaceae bacterium]|nr:hypothetical protein [Streptosporangiaceae bacterium]
MPLTWSNLGGTAVEEAKPKVIAAPANTPRAGFEYGIPPSGLTEYSQAVGDATQTDRRAMQTQLYESMLACPWAAAAIHAVSRTITGGGLVFDWDGDDQQGDEGAPEKPAEVLACERLFRYTNQREDIRQLLRSTIEDLEVFGDAYIEVCWLGNMPAAMYTLDAPSMSPLADQHGNITGYVQLTDLGQRAEFEPRDVIHISLDSPRSGIFGVSPTQMALLPITAWLFASATLKEIYRKGAPPNIHVDQPAGMPQPEVNRWLAQYNTRNIGPRNIGNPIVTKGGATIHELQAQKVQEILHTLDQKRDEILASYGVPPAEAGVIESGNIGSGTGEAQRKTFLINTCQPIAALVLEKLNFHLVARGFGITGWHLKFEEVDMRDSKTVEDIRDQRLRNGAWTLDRYRAEIGEPPVDGGNTAVLVDRQNLVKWRDMDAFSKSMIAKNLRGTTLEPAEPGGEETPVSLVKSAPQPVPAALQPGAVPGDDQEEPPADLNMEPTGDAATPPSETTDPNRPVRGRPDRETWRAYRSRMREALNELPDEQPGA